MPALLDPRQEAFAQARARGAHRMGAAAEAGYRDNGSKLAKRPHVIARVAELQENIELVRRADLAGTIADLVRLSDALAGQNTPAALKEALAARKEAHHLYVFFALDVGHGKIPLVVRDTLWMERFGPNAAPPERRPRPRKANKSKRARKSGVEAKNPAGISIMEQYPGLRALWLGDLGDGRDDHAPGDDAPPEQRPGREA